MNLLQSSARLAAIVGALGSASFSLYAGRRNSSWLLLGLFVIWVISPFAALLWASIVSFRWSTFAVRLIYGLMLILAAVSLAVFGSVALGPPRSRTAFLFLVLPAIENFEIATIVTIAELSRRR